jgi:hypothetical protein
MRATLAYDRPFRQRLLARRRRGGRIGVGQSLADHPVHRLAVEPVVVELPLGHGRLVGLVGDHHEQNARADVSAGFGHRSGEPGRGDRMRLGRVQPHSLEEVRIAMAGGESHAGVALAGADDPDRRLRLRQQAAIGHLEELALEIAASRLPELAHDLHVLARLLVAARVVHVARPQTHLLVLGALPAGDDVEAEPAARDLVDGDGHARGDGRRHGQRSDRGVELDAPGDRRQRRHQGERLEIEVPEMTGAAEAAQLDHREREVEAIGLGLLHDGAVELEARQVLRRRGRDEPAVIADRDEDADLHAPPQAVIACRYFSSSQTLNCCRVRSSGP